MIPGGGGIAGQEEHVRKVIAFSTPDGLEVQHGGDEHDAIQIEPMGSDELATECCGSGSAVAFADEELRRRPARMFADIKADEFADAFGIFVHAEEVLGILWLGRAAVTGAHGVDEDEVGFIQQAEFVFHKRVRRWHSEAIVAKLHALGSEQAHVHPDGGRAGTTIEGKRQRAGGGIGDALLGVGDEEDVRRGFALGIFECQRACRGGVVYLLATESEAVLGLRFLVGLCFVFLLLVVFFLLGFGCWFGRFLSL